MKQKTEFVKRMEFLNSLLIPKLLWDSLKMGTYVKKRYGKLI